MSYVVAITGKNHSSRFADRCFKQPLTDEIVLVISTHDTPCLSLMNNTDDCLFQDSEFSLNPVDSKKQLKRSNNYFEQQVLKKSSENGFQCGKHHKGKKYKRK